MSALSDIIDGAIASVIAEHPKLFTAQSKDRVQKILVREIMKALVKEPRDGEIDKDGRDIESPPTAPQSTLISINDARAIAYAELRRLAGAVAPMRVGGNHISLPPHCDTLALKLFAVLPKQDKWHFITNRRQLAAWFEFFAEALPSVTRRSILETRIAEGPMPGVLLPWVWPPSKAGKTYDVVPSDERID